MAFEPVKMFFPATCLKLQLPDMANEFYNQKLKWISCSRCFYSGNYQTFLAAHLSLKGIELCTSIMCCHRSIAQLYQTFHSRNWINFLWVFFFFFPYGFLITFTEEHVYCKDGEPIMAPRKATFKRKVPQL